MTMTIDPSRVQPGDVILVFTSDKGAALNVVGQTLLRLRAWLSGKAKRARHSHVMLGVLQGVVIHADGVSVKTQRLGDALGGNHVERGRFSVMRPNPPLAPGTGIELINAAQAFIAQKYSFVPGRRSTMLGRWLHRGRPLTHPFCSELVAFSYSAIGRPIIDRPPDSVLPIDLERYCVAPAWSDVTDTYEAISVPPVIADKPVPFDGREETLANVIQGMDDLLGRMAGREVEKANLSYQIAYSLVEQCILVQQLKGCELQLAQQLAMKPSLFFEAYASVTRTDLASMATFYEELLAAPRHQPAPFAKGIERVCPHVAPTQRAYESLPSADEIRRYEQLGNSLAFGARVLRLESELLGIASGLGLPAGAQERFVDLSAEQAKLFAAEMPVLGADDVDRLKRAVEEIVVPGFERYAADLRRRCRNVVLLHEAVSLLRR